MNQEEFKIGDIVEVIDNKSQYEISFLRGYTGIVAEIADKVVNIGEGSEEVLGLLFDSQVEFPIFHDLDGKLPNNLGYYIKIYNVKKISKYKYKEVKGVITI
jgi:hypothetical protein